MRKRAIRDNKLVLKAAFLRGQELLQRDIAERLGVSQPEVSRLLGDAEDQGILVTKPVFVRSKVPDQLRPLLQSMETEYTADKDVTSRLKKLAPRGVSLAVSPIASTREQFAHAAAERVHELIRQAHRIGVMWGRTIQKVTEGIEVLWGERDFKANPTLVIPLCGEPLVVSSQDNVMYSASALASRLQAALLPAKKRCVLSLMGVPAYIPQDSEAHREALNAFFRTIPGYRAIFVGSDGQAPLVEGVDTILTGIGVFGTARKQGEDATGTFLRERIEQEDDVRKSELRKLVYGDLGGVLVRRPDLGEEQASRVDALNRGWMGIQYEHFERCAASASATGCPGVVVIATGEAKAQMVVEIVRRGLVNELIVDTNLLQRLGRDPRLPR